jgi:hypothetical protein
MILKNIFAEKIMKNFDHNIVFFRKRQFFCPKSQKIVIGTQFSWCSRHTQKLWSAPRDRCYDFKNIFAENFCKKLAFLTLNKAKFCKKLIIILALRKTPIFCRKLCEIVQNCDHNRSLGIPTQKWMHPETMGRGLESAVLACRGLGGSDWISLRKFSAKFWLFQQLMSAVSYGLNLRPMTSMSMPSPNSSAQVSRPFLNIVTATREACLEWVGLDAGPLTVCSEQLRLFSCSVPEAGSWNNAMFLHFQSPGTDVMIF